MSVIHKFTGSSNQYSWQDVESLIPSEEGIKDTTKQIVLGEKDGAPHFITRYFRVDAGGYSPQHTHPHEHQVIIMHGKGEVQIGDKSYAVAPHDAILISGGDLHQLRNTGEEPLGFLCIIPKI